MTETEAPPSEWDLRKERWDQAKADQAERLKRGRPTRGADGAIAYEEAT